MQPHTSSNIGSSLWRGERQVSLLKSQSQVQEPSKRQLEKRTEADGRTAAPSGTLPSAASSSSSSNRAFTERLAAKVQEVWRYQLLPMFSHNPF